MAQALNPGNRKQAGKESVNQSVKPNNQKTENR
jgi:hypothetical protein